MTREVNDMVRALGVFADYVNAPGSARMQIITDQRRLFDDPTSGGPQAYAAAVRGLKHTVATGDVLELRRMVPRASPTMVRHYEALAAGMNGFIEKVRPAHLACNAATWRWDELTVNVNQQVGMTIKGKPVVAFLYLKAPVLDREGATKVIWRTLELTVDRVLPGASVAVLDVRRGRLWPTTSIDRDKLDRWITSEAVGYLDHWRRAA